MSKVQQQWQSNKLIGINSIIYNDFFETVTLINFYRRIMMRALYFHFVTQLSVVWKNTITIYGQTFKNIKVYHMIMTRLLSLGRGQWGMKDSYA